MRLFMSSGFPRLVISLALVALSIPMREVYASCENPPPGVRQTMRVSPSPHADVNDDGLVNSVDLTQMLGAWGEAPTEDAPPVCPLLAGNEFGVPLLEFFNQSSY